ncbi:DUF4326 domain-containing protein [Nonomuraea pusilla]|uniref:DUF4326 domain-containing protein n=1 Tax=Nonomuraea pusilla TaxID=46177 RepID=A0A1H8K5E4_9ACTN|nr:DUF4326 domain-containing protein [Nonomuraea pusilla]SEN88259.1 protein of unknown function [Nonomuraea pusilla]
MADREPKRIRRERTKGYKLPEGAVCVDRTTRWGNPFRVGDPCPSSVLNVAIGGTPLARQGVVEDRKHAVELFSYWLMAEVPYTSVDIRRDLAGRDLACWCPLPEPGEADWCHAALLLILANGEPDA